VQGSRGMHACLDTGLTLGLTVASCWCVAETVFRASLRTTSLDLPPVGTGSRGESQHVATRRSNFHRTVPPHSLMFFLQLLPASPLSSISDDDRGKSNMPRIQAHTDVLCSTESWTVYACTPSTSLR
jgi:hypothetical protein